MENKIIINLGNTKGIIKKVDNQSRVVIPKEFANSEIELFMTEDGLFIRKVK